MQHLTPRVVFIVTFALVVAASAGARQSTPAEVVKALASAANAGQYAAVEKLLSADAAAFMKGPAGEKAGGVKGLVAQWSKNGTITCVEIVKEEISGDTATVTARISYKDGSVRGTDVTRLIKENDDWRIAIGGAPPQTSGEIGPRIDEIVRKALADTGVPSASIAVVKAGRIAYVQAYGDARLEPRVAAQPGMRYNIGSVSKQFTAAAMLLLQEQGTLSLDDNVSRFLPDLTRAGEVKLRQLLSHTAGYPDYWPEDYVGPSKRQMVTTPKIMELWAHRALDFDPGTKWQYSSTNYVIAGAIVEQASGKSLQQFFSERIFKKLGMSSVLDVNHGRLPESDPTGYMRYALGPLRVASKEGAGWQFGAGGLAMTAEDLARWDVSLMGRTLLATASYRQMEADTLLANGQSTGYGLGVVLGSQNGHRMVEHSGGVPGFAAENMTFPDDRAAIVVLINEASGAATAIARRIVPLLGLTGPPASPSALEQARKVFEDLQQGRIDRSLLTADANSYFNEQALNDYAAGLGSLGTPTAFTLTGHQLRGGMTRRVYQVRCATRTLRVVTLEAPDGKLQQYVVLGA